MIFSAKSVQRFRGLSCSWRAALSSASFHDLRSQRANRPGQLKVFFRPTNQTFEGKGSISRLEHGASGSLNRGVTITLEGLRGELVEEKRKRVRLEPRKLAIQRPPQNLVFKPKFRPAKDQHSMELHDPTLSRTNVQPMA